VVLLIGFGTQARGGNFLDRWFRPPDELQSLNRQLKGQVLDFTANHGTDRRICSEALGEKRDLYVYVPPGYDPKNQYPLIYFFHGIGHDERGFLEFIDIFDHAIACGKLTPAIIACPDGSICGRPTLRDAGSFYVNSKAGRFEDYTMHDVWNFLHQNFSIRPELEAHAFIGGSMGGFGAYNLSIKYRDRISMVAAIFPPLNLRYLDCHGRYFGNFDPCCLGWRTELHPYAPVGRFYGVITVRERRLTDPLFGRSSSALARISRENPVEMLETYDLKPGELDMFVAYVGKDEFNIDAQVESFLFIARSRGLTVDAVCDPNAHHNVKSARKLTPSMVDWLAPRLASHGPIPAPVVSPKAP
jgi:S-formylglutathione hydrolase FrmB